VGREVILRDLIDQHVGASPEPQYDYVLMDCPPSLGVLTLNGLCAANEVFIPLQPHYLALQGLGKLLETVSLVGQRINPGLQVTGVMVCMNDAGTKLASEVIEDVRTFFEQARGTQVPWSQTRVFETVIRRNIKLAESPSHGLSIFDYAPDSNGAKDYERLGREVHDPSSLEPMDETETADEESRDEPATEAETAEHIVETNEVEAAATEHASDTDQPEPAVIEHTVNESAPAEPVGVSPAPDMPRVEDEMSHASAAEHVTEADQPEPTDQVPAPDTPHLENEMGHPPVAEHVSETEQSEPAGEETPVAEEVPGASDGHETPASESPETTDVPVEATDTPREAEEIVAASEALDGGHEESDAPHEAPDQPEPAPVDTHTVTPWPASVPTTA
jgi:hypothetical protein